MGYQFIPVVIFFLAVFGLILLVLKKLPEANQKLEIDKNLEHTDAQINLNSKGLPTIKFSKLKYHFLFFTQKIWRFALEAKEMVPTGKAVIKVKKLFLAKPKNSLTPNTLNIESEEEPINHKQEADYFELIKQDPKNLDHYDALGKYYLSTGKFADAKDIYVYLTAHNSANADYWARLGFTCFKLKDYSLSTDSYKKSIALDSGRLNRYYNLAQGLKALGEIEEANTIITTALEMDPQNFKFLDFKNRLKA
jgi:tetratricopeptide (TPR) repeat protein